MDGLRFGLIAVALFGLAFVGVSWASKGFPVMTVRVAAMKPDAPALKEGASQHPHSEAEPAKDRDRSDEGRHDPLALTAIRAAEAYLRSPCDQAAKTAFVVAASTYLRRNAAEPSRAADGRVRAAIKAAFEAGDMNREDFPSGTEISDMAARPAQAERCANSAALQPR